jgi:hypothetical protein
MSIHSGIHWPEHVPSSRWRARQRFSGLFRDISVEKALRLIVILALAGLSWAVVVWAAFWLVRLTGR